VNRVLHDLAVHFLPVSRPQWQHDVRIDEGGERLHIVAKYLVTDRGQSGAGRTISDRTLFAMVDEIAAAEISCVAA
jgi:hypothetical protein